MFFYPSDIDKTIISEFQLDNRNGRKSFLKDLAEEILRFPEDYQLFGPYWWYIREQFKIEGIARRGWFHNSTGEPEIVEQLLNESPAEVLAASLQYLRLMQESPQPLMQKEQDFHLWEYDGAVEMRPVVDSDYNCQGDLFAEMENSENEKREFLSSPENYIPRIWKEKGNEFLAQGLNFRAYRCFQRYLNTAEDNQSRADAWLLTGLAFQQKGHHAKAVFAFSNAYERDNQDWILAHLAEAYVEQGNVREGLNLFERLHSQMPGNPEYSQRVDVLKKRIDSSAVPQQSQELPFHTLKRRLV